MTEGRKNKSMVKDSFNRVHDYLRISLTDNCNMRCFYCMPDEEYLFTPTERLMNLSEIEQLADIFVGLGVKKIRLTGGEPLIRKDAAKIILALSRLPVELTLTTNGSRLHEFIDVLLRAHLQSVNISLDTLEPEKFLLMTRRDNFHRVKENIDLALGSQFRVKVNVVLIKGLNDQEIRDFIAWTAFSPVHVRFIEYMPFSGNGWSRDKLCSLQEILEEVAKDYSFIPLAGKANDTSKNFMVPGHQGTFAVISTMTMPFCSSCNRMRLTADGKLKNCLFSRDETDLLTPLRMGQDVKALIHQSIGSKAEELGGQFSVDLKNIEARTIRNRSMITIGG